MTLAWVVRKVNNASRQINLTDSVVYFANIYPLDSAIYSLGGVMQPSNNWALSNSNNLTQFISRLTLSIPLRLQVLFLSIILIFNGSLLLKRAPFILRDFRNLNRKRPERSQLPFNRSRLLAVMMIAIALNPTVRKYQFVQDVLSFLLKKVVWNSTFEIGAGTARSTVHGDIVCVRYSPRGAEGGPTDFKKNILPKTGMLKRTESV